jgi:hypothetical protein
VAIIRSSNRRTARGGAAARSAVAHRRRGRAARGRIVDDVRRRGDGRCSGTRAEVRRDRRAARGDARGDGAAAARCPPPTRDPRGGVADPAGGARRCRRVDAWRRRRASRIEQRVTPLDRVGCYVPGGRYPLPSSLLMTAIPARVAGVPEIIAVCPRPDDRSCCRGDRGGGRPAVPARRRARHCGAGLRHRHRAARGQDRRPWQRVRRGRQGARVARLRDRLLRRPQRDRGRFRDGRESRRGSPRT